MSSTTTFHLIITLIFGKKILTILFYFSNIIHHPFTLKVLNKILSWIDVGCTEKCNCPLSKKEKKKKRRTLDFHHLRGEGLYITYILSYTFTSILLISSVCHETEISLTINIVNFGSSVIQGNI